MLGASSPTCLHRYSPISSTSFGGKRASPAAFAAIDRVFAAFGLFIVDVSLLQQARALPGNDFEDNVQIACATNAGLDLIITRNPTDFRASPVTVIEPPQITAYLAVP